MLSLLKYYSIINKNCERTDAKHYKSEKKKNLEDNQDKRQELKLGFKISSEEIQKKYLKQNWVENIIKFWSKIWRKDEITKRIKDS